MCQWFLRWSSVVRESDGTCDGKAVGAVRIGSWDGKALGNSSDGLFDGASSVEGTCDGASVVGEWDEIATLDL